jgi:prepilin-type N-terminal cleavage/methylation domain-containing protein
LQQRALLDEHVDNLIRWQTHCSIGCRGMHMFCGSQRGFSLPELMLTVATAATIMALAVPVLTDVSESTKLNGATREVERELQSARLKAVSANRSLRVRFNCPEAGYYRSVEVLGTAADGSTTRCNTTAYPFPADNDVLTRPNYDGPVRILPHGATVTTEVIEFRPDGTAHQVVANTAVTMATPLTLTVTRNSKSRTVTVNASGKIELQLQ